MKQFVIGVTVALVSFCAFGYLLGKKNASDPDRLAAYVASQTQVVLENGVVRLEFGGVSDEPYWTYDLTESRGIFHHAYILRSLQAQTLAAESDLLLSLAAGTAGAMLTYASKDLAQTLFEGRLGLAGLRRKVSLAAILGAVSGFGVGYNLGLASIDSSSSTVLSYLRDAGNVERVKKLVFASLWSKQELEPKEIAALWICSTAGSEQEPRHGKANPHSADHGTNDRALQSVAAAIAEIEAMVDVETLMLSIQEALSSDQKKLVGAEFMVFFLSPPLQPSKGGSC